MKRHTITLGASTTAGGKVISASSHGSINGVPIALEDDMIACKGCKSAGKIVCVGPRIPETWNGKQVALENDLCACGCTPPPRLLTNQRVRYQTLADERETADSSAVSPATGTAAASPQAMAGNLFDDKYALIDDATGQPLPNTDYAIVRASGQVEFGTTDNSGRTHLLAASAHSEPVDIYL